MIILELLKKYEEMRIFNERVLSFIMMYYEKTPRDIPAQESASAGNLYDLLSRLLEMNNGPGFQATIKKIIVS